MSIIIFDNTTNTFKEAESLQKYNPEETLWAECDKALTCNNNIWESKYSKSNKLWLYNYGNECVDITGGWIARGQYYANSAIESVAPAIVKYTDHIHCELPNGSRNYNANGNLSMASQIQIDLTNYSKICCDFSAHTQGNYSYMFLECTNIAPTAYLTTLGWTPIYINSENIGYLSQPRNIKEIDISSKTGYCHLYFQFTIGTSSSTYSSYTSLDLYGLWLE